MDFKVYKYDNRDVTGVVSIKLDGVRLHVKNSNYLSRANKPLYNLPIGLEDGIYEVYRNSFKDTISVVRSSKTPKEPITKQEVYRLDKLDPRLVFSVGQYNAEDIAKLLNTAIQLGYEGLVIHANKMYKVKKAYTEDLEVLDIIPGKGKYQGSMGALVTSKGNVGTGYTDIERKEALKWKGKIIEVGYMEKTAEGKLRHPRFIRLREDKK